MQLRARPGRPRKAERGGLLARAGQSEPGSRGADRHGGRRFFDAALRDHRQRRDLEAVRTAFAEQPDPGPAYARRRAEQSVAAVCDRRRRAEQYGALALERPRRHFRSVRNSGGPELRRIRVHRRRASDQPGHPLRSHRHLGTERRTVWTREPTGYFIRRTAGRPGTRFIRRAPSSSVLRSRWTARRCSSVTAIR